MKKIIFIVLLMANTLSCKSQKDMKIVYVYDALCGWCYGFSPVINDFKEKYKDSLEFEVLSGGMITGDRIGPIGEVAPYISQAYKDVEKTTGIEFGENFLQKTLKEGSAIFTSIPPAIALSVFKELDSTRSFLFAAELQKAIYYDGIEPENIEAYGTIAAKFDLDKETFVKKMKDPLYKEMAQKEFDKSSELDVTGFPTVLLEIDGKHYKIGNGYMSLSQLENNYLAIKNKTK